MNPSSGSHQGINRRTLLRGAAVGASALALPGLTACGGGAGPAAAGENVPLPDFVPARRVKPDLPGNAKGLEDAYLRSTSEYHRSVKRTPGSGGQTRVFVLSYTPPPPPLSKNAWWQAANKQVGTELKMEITPGTDYAAKFGSVMAGEDIPDLVQIPLWMNLPRIPSLLSNRFADLSDHLSGENVREYPNLAGIPTYAWRNARVRGRIYGVPLTRPIFGGPMLVRSDLLDKLGVDAAPASADEFEALCKEVTDPKARRWALGSEAVNNYGLDFFAQMYGIPRTWRQEKDGRLTRDWETPEYVEAVAYARKLHSKGYYHPDSSSTNASQLKELFAGGKVLMHHTGIGAWRAFYDVYEKAVPGLKVDALVPFGHDGGEGTQYLDNGAFSIMAVKQGDTERVEEMLRILNFFAAPQGSKESLLRGSGVEGIDFEFDENGTPQPTERGKLEVNLSLGYICGPASAINGARFPEWARQQYEWEKKVLPMGVGNPATGMYSETAGERDAQLIQSMKDTLNNVVSGRAPVSAFTDQVKAWRDGGGDRIREELQKAIAADKE